MFPSLLPSPKDPHRARGADVAGIASTFAVIVFGLLFSPVHAAIAGLLTAPLSAYIAGRIFERIQLRRNQVSSAHGGAPLYAVGSLDAWATLRGGVPVMLPMTAMLLLVLAQ